MGHILVMAMYVLVFLIIGFTATCVFYSGCIAVFWLHHKLKEQREKK